MTPETFAAYRWLTSKPEVTEEVNRMARRLKAAAPLAEELCQRVQVAMPYTVKPGEPEDQRATVIEGLRQVDWGELAAIFLEIERRRSKLREARKKRQRARKRRCHVKR